MIEMKLNRAALEDIVDPMWRRQVPFAMSHAINRTLIASRIEQQKAMDRQIQGGPTRFTRAGIRYKSSKKRDLQGTLYYAADRPYMKTIIDGGQVIAKRKKLSEPVSVRLDKFGNIPSGGGKNKYTARAKGDSKFFLGIPRGRRGERFRGIWKRTGKPGYSKRGKARGKIKLMVSWSRGNRSQNKSFNAYKVVQDHAPQYFRRQLAVSLRKAIRTSKNRRPTGF